MQHTGNVNPEIGPSHSIAGPAGDPRPRLLLVEDDPDVLLQILQGLERPCVDPQTIDSDGGACRCAAAGGAACCRVLQSLRDLHEVDLAAWEVVVCAASLPDGSGLDALAYLRGIRPDLPVILTGELGEVPLALESIRAGAADFLVTIGSELRTIGLAVEKCLAQQRIRCQNQRLQEDLTRSLTETAMKNRQLQTLIQQLEALTRTDELTGLCNRRWLNLVMERVWAEALRHGQPLAFIMIDLDGFKAINDALGHQRGDAILRTTARVIEANCRNVDFVARYGGDEFCILMPQTEVDEAAAVAQRILVAFAQAMTLPPGLEHSHAHASDVRGTVRTRFPEGGTTGADSLRPSLSIGLSHLSLSHPSSAEQLLAHADEAMYAAKAAGPNRVMIREGTGPREPNSRPAGRAAAAR